jgi:hypothetical protein
MLLGYLSDTTRQRPRGGPTGFTPMWEICVSGAAGVDRVHAGDVDGTNRRCLGEV